MCELARAGIMFFGYVGATEAKGFQYVIDKTKNDLLTAVRSPPESAKRDDIKCAIGVPTSCVVAACR